MKKLASAALVIAPMMLLAGCSKPSQDEVHKNLVEDAKGIGATDEQATAFADCAAPKLHEELSASSLNTLIDEGVENAKVAEDDADAGTKIIDECLTEIGAA